MPDRSVECSISSPSPPPRELEPRMISYPSMRSPIAAMPPSREYDTMAAIGRCRMMRGRPLKQSNMSWCTHAKIAGSSDQNTGSGEVRNAGQMLISR